MNVLNRIARGSRDMTQGTPWKAILAFSLPLLAGNLLQQLYNTVDSIVVGRYVGREALAAVGTSFPAMMLMFALFMGIATGTNIIDLMKHLNHTDRTTFIFSTHDPKVMERADRVVRLADGRVAGEERRQAAVPA